MLLSKIRKTLEDCITEELTNATKIEQISHVSGGSINRTYQLKTNNGNFFLKQNSAIQFPKMFEAEAFGLTILSKNTLFKIPKIIGEISSEGVAFLILEFLENEKLQNNFWANFGFKLAQMHRQTIGFYGLERNNYIGSIPQSNLKKDTWSLFFAEERLTPLVKIAFDKKLLSESDISNFDIFLNKIDEIFPKENSSLLHGDLWSGNFLCHQNQPVLIDPAIYYGHREMDLAMTRLFGGFNPKFYAAYQEEFPLENDWQNRVDVCNLYPNLVHLILFGKSYYSSIKQMLNRF